MQIGERIAAYRKRRGMSQDALAGLVGMSRSWLSQVERGIHTVDRLSTLTDLAAVLRVDVADLVGREWRLAPNGGSHVQAINAIGGQLADYSYLVGERRPPWPLPQLRNATVEIHRAYQAAHYDRAAVALPKVLAAADAYDGYGGRNGREVYLTRSMVYAVAAKLLTKVGEGHLAWLAADRATHAAMTADSVTAQGVAAYQVVCALLEDEQIDQAERAAVSFAERLTAQAASDAPDTVSLAGALWLIAGVIAARKSDRSTAINRLDTAEQLTGLIGHDGNHAWTAFGPTNVRIHRASCFAELGDPYAVLGVATEVDVNALPEGLNGRRSRMHLDLAWAQTQARNDMEAILHLQQAEQVAPEVLRYDRIARGLVRELLRRARRPRPALNLMATRAGILT